MVSGSVGGSEPHADDGDRTDGGDGDELSLADAMGDPGDDARGRGEASSRPCDACGHPATRRALTRLAIRDDGGVSHALVCDGCLRAAADPPACAVCSDHADARYETFAPDEGVRVGVVCADCRMALCR